jgi:serine/threonine-protein kinase HipA
VSGRTLAVVLYGRHIADLVQDGGGAHSLTYVGQPGPTPVSLSMPLQQPHHRHRVVEPFLEGLLPDREDTRDAMGRTFGVSGRNPFALLAHIGLDCAGAVQFADPGALREVLDRDGVLEPIDDRAIGARLRALRAGATASWTAPRERWSLAGAQAKVALRRTEDGTWREALGSEPTTHIIKPGVAEFAMQALNEHVCLDAAARLDLAAAESAYTEFDGEPAIVVTRYDRRITRSGLQRVHQEDMCQASSVSPRKKYESDGGPSAADVIDLLRRHGQPSEQPRNVERFTALLAYNYLIGAPDAHAKNYSVLLIGDSVRLAPLYDAASGLPYDTDIQTGLRSAAMAIGGERRFGHVHTKQWTAFAAQTRQDADAVLGMVRRLATTLPDALSDALSSQQLVGPAAELRERLLDKVADLCLVTVGEMDRAARYRPTRPTTPGQVLRGSRAGDPATGDSADRAAMPALVTASDPAPEEPVHALSGPDSFLADPPFTSDSPDAGWLVLRALARFRTRGRMVRLPRSVDGLKDQMPSALLARWREWLVAVGLAGELRDVVVDRQHSGGPSFVVTQAIDIGLSRGPDAVLRVGVFAPSAGDGTLRDVVEVWLPARTQYPLALAVATLGDAARHACATLPAWLAGFLDGVDTSSTVLEAYSQVVMPGLGLGTQIPLRDVLDLGPLGPPSPRSVLGLSGAARVGAADPGAVVARILDEAAWDQQYLGTPRGLFSRYLDGQVQPDPPRVASR